MKFVKWLKELSKKDLPSVGGKAANLGEMFNAKLPVPDAFVVTTDAYKYFLEKTGLKRKIFEILERTDVNNTKQLQENTAKIRELIENAMMPEEVKMEIVEAYKKLSEKFGKDEEYVAVRSSATAEDVPSIAKDEFVLVKVDGVIRHLKMEELFKKFKNCIIEVLSMEKGKVKWKRVSEIYEHPLEGKLFKIKTTTGKEIKISPNHSLITLNKRTFSPVVIHDLRRLKREIFVPVLRKIRHKPLSREKLKNLIPRIEVKKGRNIIPKLEMDEDFFYFLGLFVADGCVDPKTRSIILSVFEEKVVSTVKRFLKKIGLKISPTKKGEIRIYSKQLLELLMLIGLKDTRKKGKGRYLKKVPDIVFNADKKLISAFLRGCFDGDGYVEKGTVSLTNTSRELISGLTKLLEILKIDFYIRERRNGALKISILQRENKKFLKIVGFEHEGKLRRLKESIKEYERRSKHHDFLFTISLHPDLLRKLIEENLPKEKVDLYICPQCGNKLEKTSYYNEKLRFYCRKCHRTFYSKDIIIRKILTYKWWDERGRFKPGSVPWNKGRLKRKIGIEFLKKTLKSGVPEQSKLFDNDIYWDKVERKEEVEYKGFVYDFVVPNVENFAAGLGGIITHNSASFAGQQLTLLNVKGAEEVVKAVQKCWASLFTARATFYRVQKGFKHKKVLIAVPVQKQLGALPKEDYFAGHYKAGVGFSVHPATGEKDKIVIEGSWGQGESVVSGAVTPDTYVLDKKTGKLIEIKIGSKEKMRITRPEGELEEIETPEKMRKTRCLTKNELKQLWKLALKLEDHYKFPQDFEWASENGKVYLVQTRPVTVFYEKKEEEIKVKQKPILKGLAASPGVAIGNVKVCLTLKDANKKMKKGDILVTNMTSPDWVPYMRIASGIITSEGGITAHAAIVSREMGIPCIVGASKSLEILKDGMVITLDARRGLVYEGKIEELLAREKALEITPEEAAKLKTKTKILMNLGEPEMIEKYKNLPFEGIGLMRIEFIIASWIGEHPNYLLEKDQEQKYIDRLAEGIARVAKAIYPRFVVVRFSDFKTNEYRELKGGKKYEPIEANPMLGWRGVSRYISKKFEKAFRLECKAIRKVRDKMKLDNVWVMLPFVRTTWEVEKCLKIMEEEGLKRGMKNFKVWLMAEVPSIIFLADEFSELCDGFSIGSNDLTQLVLGIDRDSAILANMGYFDERNEAVERAVKQLIEVAHKHNTTVSICGQAPSVYEDFTEFLVRCGIDSISVNPDVVCKTKKLVFDVETKLKE
jgi:pyruvate,water dikinase